MVTTAMPVVLLGVRAPVELCCLGAASVVADGPGWPAALVPGVAAVVCRPASRADRGQPPTQPQAVGGHAKSTPSGVAAPSLAVRPRSRPIRRVRAMAAPTPITLSANGYEFTGFSIGPPGGRPVLLLHGFPQTCGSWLDV